MENLTDSEITSTVRIFASVAMFLASIALVAFSTTAFASQNKKQQQSENNSSIISNAQSRVFVFCPVGNDADGSPACLKLLTFLKLCKAFDDYDVLRFPNHQQQKAPKGKVPFIQSPLVNGGIVTGDSTLIMNALIRSDPAKYDLDAHLSEQEKAQGIAFKVMLEESTYFAAVYVRWMTPNFESVTVPTYFGAAIPWAFIRYVVSRRIQNKVVGMLRGQGTGLLTDAEIMEKVRMEVKAVSDFLGHKKYFFGDRVSSFDATVFAHLAFLEQGNWQHEMCELVRRNQTLMNYLTRMRSEFWPELQSVKT